MSIPTTGPRFVLQKLFHTSVLPERLRLAIEEAAAIPDSGMALYAGLLTQAVGRDDLELMKTLGRKSTEGGGLEAEEYAKFREVCERVGNSSWVIRYDRVKGDAARLFMPSTQPGVPLEASFFRWGPGTTNTDLAMGILWTSRLHSNRPCRAVKDLHAYVTKFGDCWTLPLQEVRRVDARHDLLRKAARAVNAGLDPVALLQESRDVWSSGTAA